MLSNPNSDGFKSKTETLIDIVKILERHQKIKGKKSELSRVFQPVLKYRIYGIRHSRTGYRRKMLKKHP